jgi:hypothetical protein
MQNNQTLVELKDKSIVDELLGTFFWGAKVHIICTVWILCVDGMQEDHYQYLMGYLSQLRMK